MGAHFPTLELDSRIWFSTLFRMSGFLWHSSKWTHWFGHFLQYTSELEVFACSLDTNLNDVTTNAPIAPFLAPLAFWLPQITDYSRSLGQFCDTTLSLSSSDFFHYSDTALIYWYVWKNFKLLYYHCVTWLINSAIFNKWNWAWVWRHCSRSRHV